jgi:hypothetical protein
MSSLDPSWPSTTVPNFTSVPAPHLSASPGAPARKREGIEYIYIYSNEELAKPHLSTFFAIGTSDRCITRHSAGQPSSASCHGSLRSACQISRTSLPQALFTRVRVGPYRLPKGVQWLFIVLSWQDLIKRIFPHCVPTIHHGS